MYDYTYVYQMWFSIIISTLLPYHYHFLPIPIMFHIYIARVRVHTYTHTHIYTHTHRDGQTNKRTHINTHIRRKSNCMCIVCFVFTYNNIWVKFILWRCIIIRIAKKISKFLFFSFYFFYVVCSTSFYVSVCILLISYAS